MAKILKRKSIRTEILTTIFLSTFLVTAILGYLFFEFSKRRLTSMLGEVIKGVAATTANIVVPDDLTLILDNAETMKEVNAASGSMVFPYLYGKKAAEGALPTESLRRAITTYEKYVNLLARIRLMNNIDSPINIYVKDGESLQLVVTSDNAIMAGARYLIGPGVKTALEMNAPYATGIYKDKDGVWISAYAPIGLAPASRAQGIVEINNKIDTYLGRLYNEMSIIVLVCIVGFLSAALVSYKLTSRFVSAIERLDTTALELEREQYDVPVDISSRNEIGHLAETFEKMRVSIRKKIEELRLALVREKKAHLESIIAITNAIEMRDPYMGQHLFRVEKYALLIAKSMRLPIRKIEMLRYACYLHDIGKIGVTDTLLQQPKLNPLEWEQVKEHSEKGAKIIEGIEFLSEVREVVLSHQERYDGRGYPRGLKGEQIPLLARIVAVADAFDAMTTDRPYKQKIGYQEAMDRIQQAAGTQFDPEVCRHLVKYRDSIGVITEKHFKRVQRLGQQAQEDAG